jgi:DNA-binding response OmpR family regulator
VTRVLIADDEAHIRELVTLYLTKEGYSVAQAADGEEALGLFRQTDPGIVVLDLMMPKKDGFEVCREIRKTSDVPVLMLTARDEDVDKIVGLELGADDYLTKPFNPRELVARVKAVLRRYQPGRTRTPLALANLRVDKARREVTIDGAQVSLRTKEFDLLAAFVENAGIALTRDQLLESVWGFDFAGETRTVDVHVQHLRQKIAPANVEIQTLRGVGYKLVEAE